MTDTIEAVARAIYFVSAAELDEAPSLEQCGSETQRVYCGMAQAAIASHTKALIEGAGDTAAQVIDRTIARLQGLHDYAARPAWDAIVAEELAATIAALRAENERVKEEGVRAGIEAAVKLLERDDGFGEWWDAAQYIRAETMRAAAIAKGV